MELILSIIAIVISFASIIVSIAIYVVGVKREKKQATLDAVNVLQEQVFDNLNLYTLAEIENICIRWKTETRRRKTTIEKMTEDELSERNECIKEYRILSGYLARIEHFALGVNTGIYDTKTAERAATTYLVMLYRQKLKPLMDVKQNNSNTEYYAEFRKLVERIEKIERK